MMLGLSELYPSLPHHSARFLTSVLVCPAEPPSSGGFKHENDKLSCGRLLFVFMS